MKYQVERNETENTVKLIVIFTKDEFDKSLKKHEEKPKQEQLDAAINELISKSYFALIKEEKIDALGYPKITLSKDISDEFPFAYEAEVEVHPNIDLKKYTGLNIKRKAVEISNEDKENVKMNLLRNKFVSKSVEGPLKEGQIAKIDFIGRKDGVAFDGGTGQGYDLQIGSHTFVPGFEEQLVGMNVNETRFIDITFPKEYHADLAGKDVVFEVKVLEIIESSMPEITDTLVKELNLEGVSTVKGFEEYVDNYIIKNKTDAANKENEAVVFRTLRELNPVKVPQYYIDGYVNNHVDMVTAQAKQYGMSVETLLEYTIGSPSIEEFKKIYQTVAVEHLHEQLILRGVILKEKINITKEELASYYEKLASQQKTSVEEIKNKYKEEQVVESCLMEKGIKFLLDNNLVD